MAKGWIFSLLIGWKVVGGNLEVSSVEVGMRNTFLDEIDLISHDRTSTLTFYLKTNRNSTSFVFVMNRLNLVTFWWSDFRVKLYCQTSIRLPLSTTIRLLSKHCGAELTIKWFCLQSGTKVSNPKWVFNKDSINQILVTKSCNHELIFDHKSFDNISICFWLYLLEI